MTLAIPQELHRKMAQHTEIRWSDIARQSFERKLMELDLLDQALKHSKLTEKDAERLGHEIKRAIRKRLDRTGS
jgi:hypothetical protein